MTDSNHESSTERAIGRVQGTLETGLASLNSRIDEIQTEIKRHSVSQGHRIGKLEGWQSAHDVIHATQTATHHTERRFLLIGLGALQAVFLFILQFRDKLLAYFK